MNRFLSILAGVILLSSCCNEYKKFSADSNRYISIKDTLQLPFDTARVLALYNISVRSFTETHPEDLDTFVLSNMMYACDCPGWITQEELKKLKEQGQTALSDGKQHDIFYIEKGSPEIELPEEFIVFQNKIRFYGKIRTRKGWPKNTQYTDPDPPAGPVLTVYGYDVILPALIYGPEVHVPDKTGKLPDWAQYQMSVLAVTKQNYSPRKS